MTKEQHNYFPIKTLRHDLVTITLSMVNIRTDNNKVIRFIIQGNSCKKLSRRVCFMIIELITIAISCCQAK